MLYGFYRHLYSIIRGEHFNMKNFILYFVFIDTIYGNIPIENLRKRLPMEAGSSEKLYNDIHGNSFFDTVFPKMIKRVIQINKTGALDETKDKRFKTLYYELLKLDQELADVIDSYVNYNLYTYNLKAYEFITNNEEVLENEIALTHAITLLTYENQNFKFLSYLHDAGKEVEKKYNNFLFYNRLENMKNLDKLTFTTLLFDHFKKHYTVTEEMKKNNSNSNTSKKTVTDKTETDINPDNDIKEATGEKNYELTCSTSQISSTAEAEKLNRIDESLFDDETEKKKLNFSTDNALDNVTEFPFGPNINESNKNNYTHTTESSNSINDAYLLSVEKENMIANDRSLSDKEKGKKTSNLNMSNELNDVNEILSESNIDENVSKIDTQKTEGTKFDDLLQFFSDSGNLLKIFIQIKENLAQCANLFVNWTSWVNYNKMVQHVIGMFMKMPKQLTKFMFGEVKCLLYGTQNDGNKFDVQYWNYDKFLAKNDFGFLSLVRNKCPEDHPERSELDVNRSRKEFYNFSERVKTNSTDTKMFEKQPSGNKSQNNKNTLLTLELMSIQPLIGNNLNTNNVMIFYNILPDLYMIVIGNVSTKLLQGANHYLYRNCIEVKKNTIEPNVHNIQVMRSYLFLFRELFRSASKTIELAHAVDMSKNEYAIHLETELSRMIFLTTMSNYDGRDEFDSMSLMKQSIEAEYTSIRELDGLQNITVQHDCFTVPVLYMEKIENAIKMYLYPTTL